MSLLSPAGYLYPVQDGNMRVNDLFKAASCLMCRLVRRFRSIRGALYAYQTRHAAAASL
jgi:hypothetical protein